MPFCPHCGGSVVAGNKFCPSCGLSLSQTFQKQAENQQGVNAQPIQPVVYVQANDPQPYGQVIRTPMQTYDPNGVPAPTVIQIIQQPAAPYQTPAPRPGSIVRLALGIITILLAIVCVLHSLVSYTLRKAPFAYYGVFPGIFMLPAGIVVIATRRGIAGGIVSAFFLFLAAFFAFIGKQGFPDLQIYEVITVVFGVIILLVSIIWGGRGKRV